MRRKERKPWWPELSEEEKETIDYWYTAKQNEEDFWREVKSELNERNGGKRHVKKTHIRHTL